MAKQAGIDVLLSIRTGVGTYTVLGGQKDASLNRSANVIETTDKNTAGWGTNMAGIKTWSVECDGFISTGDTATEALFTAFDARTAIDITIRVGGNTDAGGYTYTGSVYITDFPEEYKSSDAVTYKLKLVGASALTRTIGAVTTPTTETVTITNPATTGFTIGLSPSLNGLTASNMTLTRWDGVVITPTGFSTADSGATYTVLATLPSGKIATVLLQKDGYNFGYLKFVSVA